MPPGRDEAPFDRRLTEAVDFVRNNLFEGAWRIKRAKWKFHVQPEDINRQLLSLGFRPSWNSRSWEVVPPSSLPQSDPPPIDRAPPVNSTSPAETQASSERTGEKRKRRGSITTTGYCSMCREERDVKLLEGQTWGH